MLNVYWSINNLGQCVSRIQSGLFVDRIKNEFSSFPVAVVENLMAELFGK